jgi:hypothetical protein
MVQDSREPKKDDGEIMDDREIKEGREVTKEASEITKEDRAIAVDTTGTPSPTCC